VIGDAPSEMDMPQFMERLGEERKRVRRALEGYRAQAATPRKAKPSPRKKTSKKRRPKKLANDKNVSADLLAEAIALLKKEKGLE
jgi:hypothetical protein